MSDPTPNDIDEELRATFARQAQSAPHADLAAAAIKRAGRIRRRRAAGTIVAVAAVAAVAIPVGSQFVGSTPDRHTASKPNRDKQAPVAAALEVQIAGLPRGAAPEVPYIDGTEYVTPDETMPINPLGGIATDATPFRDGVAVWSRDADSTKVTTGDPPAPLVSGKSATQPVVDQQNNQAAWAADEGTDSTDVLVVADTDSGQVSSADSDANDVQVMGVHDGDVVFNGVDGKTRYVGQVDVPAASSGGAGLGIIPWPDATYVTAVDSRLEKMSGHLASMKGASRLCSSMFDVSTRSIEWETCNWRPVEFSSDSSLVLAISSQTDGLGARDLAVMDADDGTVLQAFTTRGTFGRATFEGNSSLVAVMLVKDKAAIVRCSIDDATCELATDPANVTPDDPDSLQTPYQLTAN